ncbi:hypothetical protein AB0L56_02280 [Streptomyces sp. NPDC052079]|uniref:hypothetical protein n=1 Tax=Streptomyces sp. NPDC052079 TaxID=3155526 RepID=UPI00344964C5
MQRAIDFTGWEPSAHHVAWDAVERELLEAQRPGEYCILVRGDVGEWCRYEMSTSEFLYRVLADKEFKPFGIADYDLDPTFQPGRSVHGS